MSGDKLQIKLGATYSNGNFGRHWAVRQVLALGADDSVSYKVLVGEGRRNRGVSSREEFLRWARYEVVRDENSWFQVRATTPG